MTESGTVRDRYCWKCGRTAPFLGGAYVAEVSRLFSLCQLAHKSLLRLMEDDPDADELDRVLDAREELPYQLLLDRFFELTGDTETRYDHIPRHFDSAVGPDCTSCGRPLRTERASMCAACGAKVDSASLADSGSDDQAPGSVGLSLSGGEHEGWQSAGSRWIPCLECEAISPMEFHQSLVPGQIPEWSYTVRCTGCAAITTKNGAGCLSEEIRSHLSGSYAVWFLIGPDRLRALSEGQGDWEQAFRDRMEPPSGQGDGEVLASGTWVEMNWISSKIREQGEQVNVRTRPEMLAHKILECLRKDLAAERLEAGASVSRPESAP